MLLQTKANYEKAMSLIEKGHLADGETIVHSIMGFKDRLGILVATETRVVFYAERMFGFDLESFLFKNIASIEYSAGLLSKELVINSSGNDAKVQHLTEWSGGSIKDFIDYVNSNSGQSNNIQIVQDDIPSQIKKLSDLRDQGILTDDEFSVKKAELLSKM